MTRRERALARLERRREWAAARDREAASRFKASHDATAGIPFGQPILVGHHSEKRHRKAIDRSWNQLGKGVEAGKMADHHRAKADGIERQLENTIFSDDEDAIEALEAKIQKIEAECELMKRANAAFRKAKGAPGWAASLGLSEEAAAKMEATAVKTMQHYDKVPFPSYALTNRRVNIRRLKGRIEEIKRTTKTAAEAEAAGGVIVKQYDGGYAAVTFAEKPEREIINALKAADFRWGKGSWYGKKDRLPVVVKELAGLIDMADHLDQFGRLPGTAKSQVEYDLERDAITIGDRFVFRSTVQNGPMLYDVTADVVQETRPGFWMFMDVKGYHEFEYDTETVARYVAAGGAERLSQGVTEPADN